MILTQPALIESFRDEFHLPENICKIPAAPHETLVEGPLIHRSKYSRPGLLNNVRELKKFGNKPNVANYRAMLRVMKFCW